MCAHIHVLDAPFIANICTDTTIRVLESSLISKVKDAYYVEHLLLCSVITLQAKLLVGTRHYMQLFVNVVIVWQLMKMYRLR